MPLTNIVKLFYQQNVSQLQSRINFLCLIMYYIPKEIL